MSGLSFSRKVRRTRARPQANKAPSESTMSVLISNAVPVTDRVVSRKSKVVPQSTRVVPPSTEGVPSPATSHTLATEPTFGVEHGQTIGQCLRIELELNLSNGQKISRPPPWPQISNTNRTIEQKPSKRGWTPERRARQSEAIRTWKPWLKSTGPKSAAGKKASSANSRTNKRAIYRWRNPRNPLNLPYPK